MDLSLCNCFEFIGVPSLFSESLTEEDEDSKEAGSGIEETNIPNLSMKRSLLGT